MQAAEAEITRLQEIHQAELQQREAQLEQYVNTIQRLSALVREKDEEILLKESQLQQKDQELQQINADMNRLQRRLLRLQVCQQHTVHPCWHIPSPHPLQGKGWGHLKCFLGLAHLT